MQPWTFRGCTFGGIFDFYKDRKSLILGVSPAAIKPVWRNGTFEPRLLLPLSLSYDHRVIDGVAGAEFTRYLGQLLGDIRHLLL